MKHTLFKTFATAVLCCGFSLSAFAADCNLSQAQINNRAALYEWINANYTPSLWDDQNYADKAASLGIYDTRYNLWEDYYYYRNGNHFPDGHTIEPHSNITPADFGAFDPCLKQYSEDYKKNDPSNDAPPAPAPDPTPAPAPAPTPNDSGNNAQGGSVDFFTFVKNILLQDLQPLLHMTTTISYIIGLFLIIIGMSRLYRHGSGTQNMMHRTSPAATAMYFVSGIVLVSFMPYLQMISNSIFTLDASNVLMQQCGSTSTVLTKEFATSSNDFCPMMAYSQHIPGAGSDNDAVGQAMKYLIFGVLFLVGVISFIRGMIQLVRIGEGGQGGGLGKAFTHIFAGIVAVNADSFYMTFQNILESNTHS